MAIKPTIIITFKQLATSLIQRSERGTAILLLSDTTGAATGSTIINTKVYRSVADIDESLYTKDNIKHIKNCLFYAPYELIVISSNSTKFADFAKAIVKIRKTGWITFAGNDTMQSDLMSWIKSMENNSRTYKAVGTQKGADSKQYVYFNQKGIDNNGDEVPAKNYLSSLLGIIASCNVQGGLTNFLCTDLSEIAEVDNIDTAISSGQLVLTNETDGVRIVSSINSLTTTNGSTSTEDMQHIETVEAMNLIMDDIKKAFKETYQGKYKNKYTNQILFVGAVNEYFRSLSSQDILSEDFENKAEIDVDRQRSAWLGIGNQAAIDWSDDEVKKNTFGRSVFVKCNIKILNCMENLEFIVSMN